MSYAGITARGLQGSTDMTWEIDNDESTSYPDMGGSGGIIVHNNQTMGTATVTLQANSPTVALWSAAYAAQKASGVDVPLMMFDRNDDTKAVAFAAAASMKKTPPFTRGNSEPMVAFEFTFPSCTPPFQAGDV